jgi:CHAT domain-containing protein
MRIARLTAGTFGLVAAIGFFGSAAADSDALRQAQQDWAAGHQAYASADYQAAQRDWTAAYEAFRRVLGPEDTRTLDAENDLAAATTKTGDFAGAEALYRDLYNVQMRSNADSAAIFRTLNNLSVSLLEQGRAKNAEDLDLRTYGDESRILGMDNDWTLATLDNLCSALLQQGRYQEAEDRLQELYRIRLQKNGPDDPLTLPALANLTEAIEAQGRHQEAEAFATRLYAARLKIGGADHPDTIAALALLATVMEGENRHSEAEIRLRQALAASIDRLGDSHPETLQIKATLARVLRSEGAVEQSVSLYRETCPELLQGASSATRIASSVQPNAAASDCYYRLALTLRDLQSHDSTHAQALGMEAFEAAQRATQSGFASSLSRSDAIALAQAAGVGTEASQYETALDDRESFRVRFAQTLDADEQQRLSNAIRQSDATIDSLTSQLATKAPDYWNYRLPAPTRITSLQRRSGAGTELLHGDEALILWMCRRDDSHGLVFAVSPGKFAWSTIGLNGNEIADRARSLRRAIEAAGAMATGSPATPHAAFPRATAHELYVALLGDKSIQAAIENARTLLFVPCEPLADLPPSVLVVSDPPGGAVADGVPDAMRRTHWLLNDVATAVLPTVSSLEVIRLRRARVAQHDSEPLLAFADPDFTSVRGGDDSEAKWVASLQPLPGTRREVELLRSILNGSKQNVLIGSLASRAELERRQRDGSLAQVSVLEFATHGFFAGEIPEIHDASLALATTPERSDVADAFLTSSEISKLRLNADWVVLSACSTGLGVQTGGEGLSQLAGAFFYAGARSLLVSHWRVRDDAAERLVTLTFADRRDNPALDKAQALRKAMLQLMSDPSMDTAGLTFSDPSAWGPFVVVGDVD